MMQSDLIFDNAELGPYVLIERIGAGGMAAVYKAEDTRTRQTVALKVLYPHFAMQDDIIRRFEREAKIASSLKHPHILPVYEYGIIDHRPYIAIAYMSGGSLGERLINPTRLNRRAVLVLLRQVASALDYAHSHNIVHRDLKLENILLDNSNRTYLGDFGIARIIEGTRLTQTGNIIGTPRYMAPEQARGLPDMDYRVDLYGFAVMTYLLTTGFYPFTSNDPLVLLSMHVSAPPPRPTQLNPELPTAMDDVLLKGMAKQPEDRYLSATAFVDALDAAVATENWPDNTTLVNIHAPNPINAGAFDPTPVSQPVIPTVQMTDDLQADAEASIMPSYGQSSRRKWLWRAFALLLVFVTFGVAVMLTGQNPLAAVETIDTTTETITSTVTRTPTPTLTETEFPGNAYVSNEQGVNVRTGPDTGYGVITSLPQDTPLTLIGRTADATWYQARLLNGQVGWVFNSPITALIDVWTLPITWSDPLAPSPTSSGSSTGGGDTGGGNPTATPTNSGGGSSNPTATATSNPTATRDNTIGDPTTIQPPETTRTNTPDINGSGSANDR